MHGRVGRRGRAPPVHVAGVPNPVRAARGGRPGRQARGRGRRARPARGRPRRRSRRCSGTSPEGRPARPRRWRDRRRGGLGRGRPGGLRAGEDGCARWRRCSRPDPQVDPRRQGHGDGRARGRGEARRHHLRHDARRLPARPGGAELRAPRACEAYLGVDVLGPTSEEDARGSCSARAGARRPPRRPPSRCSRR